MARFSYFLENDNVYWCIEWPPGLVVVRFSKDGTMDRTAVRSQVQGFDERETEEEE